MSDKNVGKHLFETWASAQQKLLTDWIDTLRKLGGMPTLELWGRTVDTWQNAVKETLDAQTTWTHQWIDTLASTRGTPEEMRELVSQGREQLQHWAEAERNLWLSWFNVVREINFLPEAGVAALQGRDLLQLWQASAYKMIDMQTNLVRRWTGGRVGKKAQ